MNAKSGGSRRRRKDRIGSVIAAVPRFWAAMAVLPPYFFVEDLAYKVFLMAFFAILAVGAGKRIRWGYFAVLIFSITFFHLLAPKGRVLAELGPFTITAGALESGIAHGVSLVGMVFLSVAAVRPELELPGRFGGLLGRTFYHFEAILDGRGKIERKDFFGSLDRLLMERLDPFAPVPCGTGMEEGSAESPADRSVVASSSPSAAPASGKKKRGWGVGVLFAASVWGLWGVSLILPIS